MTINIPNDRIPGSSPGIDTAAGISRITSRATSFGSNDSAFGDRISVSSTTVGLNSALDQISASRASRVSHLAALYASGRYNVDSAQVGKALVGSAGAAEI